MKRRGLSTLLLVLAIPAVFVYLMIVNARSASIRADEVLAQIADGQVAEVYEEASTYFQTHYTQADLQAIVDQLQLSDYTDASWEDRVEDGEVFGVYGSIQRTDDSTAEIEIQFVFEQRGLKLYAISPGRISDRRTAPDQASIEQLVLGTIKRFEESVQANDFTSLLKSTTRDFQSGYSAAQLLEKFSFLVAQGVELDSITAADLDFSTPASVNEELLLILEGSAGHPLYEFPFQFRYRHEAGDWRLSSLEFGAQVRAFEVADEFFELIAAADYEAAAATGSARLRRQGEKRLEAVVSELGVIQFEGFAWDSSYRFATNGDGAERGVRSIQIRGEFQLGPERSVTIDVALVVEEGRWRVDQLLPTLPERPAIGSRGRPATESFASREDQSFASRR